MWHLYLSILSMWHHWIYDIWTRSAKSINKYIYLQLLQPFLRQVRCTLTWQVLHLETFLCYSSKYLKHPLQMSGVLEFSVLTRGSKSGVNWDLRLMLKGNFTWKVCWGIGYGYVRQTIVFVLQLTVLFFWEISYCRGNDLSFFGILTCWAFNDFGRPPAHWAPN